MSRQPSSGAGQEACRGNWALWRETQAAGSLIGSGGESGSQRVDAAGWGAGLFILNFEEGNEVDHEEETTLLPHGKVGGCGVGDVGAVLGSQQSKSPSAAHHSLIKHSLDKNHRASSTGHVLQGLLGESTDQYAVVDPQNKWDIPQESVLRNQRSREYDNNHRESFPIAVCLLRQQIHSSTDSRHCTLTR